MMGSEAKLSSSAQVDFENWLEGVRDGDVTIVGVDFPVVARRVRSAE
jgi:hypothetical protein